MLCTACHYCSFDVVTGWHTGFLLLPSGEKKLLLSCSAVPPVSLLLSFSCCRPLLSLLPPPPSPLPGPRPPCLVQTHIHFSHCCNRRPFCFWCVNYPDTRPHGRVADMGVFSSLCVCVCVLARSAHLTYESRNGAGPSSVSNPVGCG